MSQFNVEAYVSSVRSKLGEAARGMMDYDYLSADVFQKGDQVIQFTEKLSRMSETLEQKAQDISSNVKQKIERGSTDSGSSGTFGVGTLLSLAILVAGVIYFRVNRLHKKTHIL